MNWWCKRKRKVRVITLDKWECGSAYTLAVWLWKWNVSDSLWPHGLYSSWNSPVQNIGVGRLSLLQGIFPTRGLNPGLPRCRWILYQLSRNFRGMEEPRRQKQEQRIWTLVEEGVWMCLWELWSSLQIVSTNSEVRSQVIAENEGGEKMWELWGEEDSARKSHLVMRVLGRRDGLGFWTWYHVMILWSVHGVQVP